MAYFIILKHPLFVCFSAYFPLTDHNLPETISHSLIKDYHQSRS